MRNYIILYLILACASGSVYADEPAIDEDELLKQTEKKPYNISGFVELRPVETILNRDASLYKLNYYDSSEKKRTEEYNASVLLNGSLEFKYFSAYAKGSAEGSHDYKGYHGDRTLYEGYGSLTPYENFRINAGKESVKWGKGYAWAPTAFITRQKNADDPELDIKGYYISRVEYIKSFDGPLKTFSLTPAVLPVKKNINSDYSSKDGYVTAGKIYLLLLDTDIDFVYSYDNTNRSRYGFSFSRNLGSAIEIHGESAYLTHALKSEVSSSGAITSKETRAFVYLAGVRYLTDSETTFIVEYYHNGAGRNTDVMKASFDSIDNAYNQYLVTGNNSQLAKISGNSNNSASKSNPMRNYTYLRVSQKDPFDILYITPSITWIFNLDDHSASFSPEIVYTGITNLEFRLKSALLFGNKYSEFGEKATRNRTELRIRYSF